MSPMDVRSRVYSSRWLVLALTPLMLTACPTQLVVGQEQRDAGDGGSVARDGGCLARSCVEQGLECGAATDTCGNLLNCGRCAAGAFCGGPRGPGTCCRPRSCREARRECGPVDDGCGQQLSCGACSDGLTCGGNGLEGICAVPRCSADGWCWEGPSPIGQNIRDLFALSKDDVWLVGGEGFTGGVIARWDGLTWRDVTPEPMPGVSGVWASGPNDVWFCLRDGSVRHFDGVSWSKTQLNVGRLNAISGSGPHDVWVVGGQFSAHFDGAVWRSKTPTGRPGAQFYLTDVVSFGPADAWTVGSSWELTDAGTQSLGVAFHFDGTDWTPVVLPSGSDGQFGFDSVWGSHGGDVWLTGWRPLHWDGTTLSIPPDPGLGSQFSIGGLPSGEMWGVSWTFDAAVARFQGGAWTTMGHALDRITYGSRYLHPWAVAAVASDDVWLAGPAGVIVHWNGRELERVSRSFGVARLGAIDGMGNDIWVASQDGTLHFDGTRWEEQVLGREVTDVFAPGDGSALAVSGNDVLSSDGRVWTVALAASTGLNAIHGSSRTDVWTVGLGGVAFHRGPTGDWVRADIPAAEHLSDVFVLSPGDAWAVAGSTGTAWHWNGTTWTPFNSSTTSLTQVWASGSADVWGVGGGSSGSVVHWDGTRWSRVVGLPRGLSSPFAISGTGPRDVWLTGGLYYATAISYYGRTAHFDGAAWHEEDVGEDRPIHGLKATATDIWAVGDEGLLMRRRR